MSIPKEFQYLEKVISYRLSSSFETSKKVALPKFPKLNEWQLPVARFISDNALNHEESILLLIGLVPHIQPDFFDKIIESIIPAAGNFPKIGGVRGKNSRSFLPTGETALFILAGDDIEKRLAYQKFFGADHMFVQRKILWLEELTDGEPAMSGRIIISQDYIDTFLYGKPSPPHFSINFPAKLISEQRGWDALVIKEELHKQINEIITWVTYNDRLMKDFGMQKSLRKGYRALFYGPPGTGKTLAAGLLGSHLNKSVYKVDLSMVVSKYIGETEKNLELLFARAADKGWILFFDEADALFGKRTGVRDAHDKYANQEVSYLLQRIEDYNGLIILATNMKNNIDDAFIRRFNSILRFPLPDENERKEIWKRSFPSNVLYALNHDNPFEKVNAIDEIKKYELTGGNIINIVHYACLKGVEKDSADKTSDARPDINNAGLTIYLSDILQGIQRELNKQGKPFIG